MQRQRRAGATERKTLNSTRASPPMENGHHNQHEGGQLCPEGMISCVSAGSSAYGSGWGWCTRKSSPPRRAINVFRVHLRSRGKGMVAYLAACVLMVWVGLQLSLALKGAWGLGDKSRSSGDGGVVGVRMAEEQQQLETPAPRQRELTAAADGFSSHLPPGYREGDDGPRLAYGIMVYQRTGYSSQMTLDQFARMFHALYDKENTYVIHVDIKSDKELLEAISHYIKDLPNVYEVPSVSVSWAGVTVVERTLALMTKALEVDKTWRFFVNLGHEDYPSASQTEVRRWLKDKKDGTNYIKCWPIEGHDFFGQWERHDNRLQDVHVDDFVGGVREYRSLSGRPGSQERPKSGYKFYKSLQQTMLSRQLTEYAAYSSEARRLLLYMATSKAPDELYFPTLTQLDEKYSSMATCNDTRHFSYWIRPGGSWHPEYLTLDHLPLVLNATEFYIRKVEENRGSKPLLDTLDILREGNPIEKTLPIMIAWLNRRGEDGMLAAEGGPIMEFPEDATVEEAMGELYRRQSENAETRRALFLSYVRRRSRRRSEAMAASAAQAAAEDALSGGTKHSFGTKPKTKPRRPFGKDPAMRLYGNTEIQ